MVSVKNAEKTVFCHYVMKKINQYLSWLYAKYVAGGELHEHSRSAPPHLCTFDLFGLRYLHGDKDERSDSCCSQTQKDKEWTYKCMGKISPSPQYNVESCAKTNIRCVLLHVQTTPMCRHVEMSRSSLGIKSAVSPFLLLDGNRKLHYNSSTK